MNYQEIKPLDITNGVGIRTTIFVTGCEHYCVDCFNKELWDFNSGKLYTVKTEQEIIKNIGNDMIQGLSILGGEPLHPNNCVNVFKLTKRVKQLYPKKDIWIWSGYTIEELGEMFNINRLLKYVDVLVDGKYEKKNRDMKLKYKGSSNQRVIDIQKTLNESTISLYKDKEEEANWK